MANDITRHAPGPYNGARYIFLDNAMSRTNATHMLGAVIPRFYETHPYTHYRPNWRDRTLAPKIDGAINPKREELEDTMNQIWQDAETPVELRDVLTKRRLAVSTDAHAKFTSLLDGAVRKDFSEEIEFTSGIIKFYSFDNPGSNLPDLLLTCEPWKEQIAKLIHEDKRQNGYYIVTGVAVLKDVEVKLSEESGNNKNFAAGIPGEVLNAATQGALPITGELARAADIGGKWEKNTGKGSQTFARCNEDIILAVKYDELNFELEQTPPEQGNVEAAKASDESLNKKSGFLSRLFSSKSKKGTTSNGHASLPHSQQQQAVRKILSASLGTPIRGYGFNSALGSEESSDSSDTNSDCDDVPVGSYTSNTLLPTPERDAFYVKKSEYIRAGDGARMME